MLLCILGCTPASKQLAQSLTDAQKSTVLARQSVQKAVTGIERVMVAESTPAPVKDALGPVVDDLDTADGHMADVQELAGKAQEASAGMRDKANPWVEPLKTALVVIGMGIVLVIVWKSGVFLIVKPIFRRIGKRFASKPDEPEAAEVTPEAPP